MNYHRISSHDFNYGLRGFAKPYTLYQRVNGQQISLEATFQSEANFSHTTFHLSPSFCSATFQEKEANFSDIFSILINAPSLMWQTYS